MIAHRLATAARADRVVVLDDGRIVQDGAHGQLIAVDGPYARLWRRESGAVTDEDARVLSS